MYSGPKPCIALNMYVHILIRETVEWPTPWWGHCGRHNSPPASAVMDFIIRRSDGSHFSVDNPSISASVFLFFFSQVVPSPESFFRRILGLASLRGYTTKPLQSFFRAPLCYVLYFQSLPNVIIFSHDLLVCGRMPNDLHIFCHFQFHPDKINLPICSNYTYNQPIQPYKQAMQC